MGNHAAPMSEAHGKASELPEPKTPMWLPALGAVLFLTAAILWGLYPTSGSAETTGAAAPAGDAGARKP